MKKAFFPVLLLCCLCVCLINSRPALAQDQLSIVKDAMARFVCYQKFWMGNDYVEGASVAMEIKFEGEKFYAWTNDLPAKVFVDLHFTSFYAGRLKDGKGAITFADGHNNELPGLPPQLREYRRHFESGAIVKDTLTIPVDCAPRYDPPTPKKELMVKTVISTMRKLLNNFASGGIAKYPKEVKLIIADFNMDYPFTYVIVEPVKEVYIIRLHDWDNYDSDEYERDGDYPIGAATMKSISDRGLSEIYNEMRSHGIVRKIAIAPR